MNQNTTIADYSLFSLFPCLGRNRTKVKVARNRKDEVIHSGNQMVGKCFPSQVGLITASLAGAMGLKVESWSGRDGKRTIFISSPEGVTETLLRSAKVLVETVCSM